MLNRTRRNTSKKENGYASFFIVAKDRLGEIKAINGKARFYSVLATVLQSLAITILLLYILLFLKD